MEERVINGVLCRRLDPSGEWSPVSRPELTKMLVDLRKAYKLLAVSTSLIAAKGIYDETLDTGSADLAINYFG